MAFFGLPAVCLSLIIVIIISGCHGNAIPRITFPLDGEAVDLLISQLLLVRTCVRCRVGRSSPPGLGPRPILMVGVRGRKRSVRRKSADVRSAEQDLREDS
ncbi:hypothetical protein AOLI_G00301180 [Acnodon oligacanthus]